MPSSQLKEMIFTCLGQGAQTNKQTNKHRQKHKIIEIDKVKLITSRLKPRPNDRNMSTQHIATLLGATCCVRLATVLRYVETWWVLLAQI